jgi:transcriptional regulator with XRE-family HTH domain
VVAEPLAPEEIKALREREQVSQPVFARYLNVSRNLVSDWERGVKRPGGPALRLLLDRLKKRAAIDRLSGCWGYVYPRTSSVLNSVTSRDNGCAAILLSPAVGLAIQVGIVTVLNNVRTNLMGRRPSRDSVTASCHAAWPALAQKYIWPAVITLPTTSALMQHQI